ncbi:MAG TPA: DUF1559 domain-containing protein, partial [Planctomycetaceae bacterium]|nr:DUF1559 domain-containing protein [Planctomycetaceae bacterium]
NHLKQLGLAVHNYLDAYRYLPPSATIDLRVTSTGNNTSWGIHGRILPYLEQINVARNVDLSIAWDFQAAIDGVKIPVYACPSDPKSDQARDPGGGKVTLYPTTYGFNFGTWFVFDPGTGRGGDGAFFPNSRLAFRDFLDGTSNTLMASEVKAWQAYTRNAGPPSTNVPNSVAEVQAAVASGARFKTTGHTEWPDGRVHHEGFTTTLPPNTFVPHTVGGTTYDCDYNSWQEGRDGGAGRPTYAAITSRSYHSGSVNVLLVDGSVRTVNDSIDRTIWRALGTRAGGEVVGAF